MSKQSDEVIDGAQSMQQTALDVDEIKRLSSLHHCCQFSSNVPVGKQLRQELWKWLSPPDPSTNHNIACNSHHEGTAAWFLQGSIFEEWKSTPLSYGYMESLSANPIFIVTYCPASTLLAAMAQQLPVMVL
ncbi:hypothetical protein BGW80DRAFT_1281765 [Lactifluus volemus]|nr:hypothetical protein BGW80DRAFT_1281765 [Lactifluus volemus]